MFFAQNHGVGLITWIPLLVAWAAISARRWGSTIAWACGRSHLKSWRGLVAAHSGPMPWGYGVSWISTRVGTVRSRAHVFCQPAIQAALSCWPAGAMSLWPAS